MKALLCSAIVIVTVCSVAHGQTLQAALLEKETALSSLVSKAESIHPSRCSKLAQCQSGSRQCSIAACGDSFPSSNGFFCSSQYGLDSETCGATCPGMVRSQQDTVVRVPPGTDFTDPEVQAFTCSSTDMNSEFVTQHNAGNGALKAWSYVGHFSGSIRISPGAPQGRDDGQCSTYDARLRPWFIAASGGPKDVVLILDRSGSMNDADSTNGETRIELLKSAVNAILGTLTQNDFVNVVQFNGQAELLSGTGLLQATEANVKLLQGKVTDMYASSTTSFIPAFQKGMPLFSDQETSSGCTRVVLFLTDGIPTESQTDILAAIETEQVKLQANGGKRAHIFTFSMSSKADNAIPQAIACANEGVWAGIQNSENPLAKMNAYYQFLASGIDDRTVRWTTPYIDDFGLGQMVTAARAIYDRSNAVPVLIGVAGADITISELEQYGTFQSIVSELVSRSKTCPSLNLTECQIQHLRGLQGYRCPLPSPTEATCNALNEVVELSKCSANGGLNDYFCSSISTSGRAGSKSTASVSCCNSNTNSGECNGAATVSLLSIAVAALLMLLF